MDRFVERFALDLAAAGMLEAWAGTLAVGVDLVGADIEAGLRLDETRRFFDFLRAEMPALMRRWGEQR